MFGFGETPFSGIKIDFKKRGGLGEGDSAYISDKHIEASGRGGKEPNVKNQGLYMPLALPFPHV